MLNFKSDLQCTKKSHFKPLKRHHWGPFMKAKQKIYSVRLSYLGVYRKPMPKTLEIDKILAESKNIPRFSYLSKSNLC